MGGCLWSVNSLNATAGQLLPLRPHDIPHRPHFIFGIYTCDIDNILKSYVVDKLDIPIDKRAHKETSIIHHALCLFINQDEGLIHQKSKKLSETCSLSNFDDLGS